MYDASKELKTKGKISYDVCNLKVSRKLKPVIFKMVDTSILIEVISEKTATLNSITVYKIRVKNIGNIDYKNVLVKDNLPDELCFIKGSVTVNNIKMLCLNIEDGIIFKELPVGSEMIITFKARVVKMPKEGYIVNGAQVVYLSNGDCCNKKCSNKSCLKIVCK